MPESTGGSTSELDTLARNVVLFRARKGMSQERLAEESGLSRATISNVERAQGSPNIGVVIDIAHALGVNFVDLFAGEEPAAPVSDARIADLKAGRPSSDSVKAQSLLRAIDEAAGHSPERYSRAGRPRATVQ